MLESLIKSFDYLPRVNGELDRQITVGQSAAGIEIILYVNVHGQGAAVSKMIDLRQLKDTFEYELEQLCREIEGYVNSERFTEGHKRPWGRGFTESITADFRGQLYTRSD